MIDPVPQPPVEAADTLIAEARFLRTLLDINKHIGQTSSRPPLLTTIAREAAGSGLFWQTDCVSNELA
jgi:hypothetical protein